MGAWVVLTIDTSTGSQARAGSRARAGSQARAGSPVPVEGHEPCEAICTSHTLAQPLSTITACVTTLVG